MTARKSPKPGTHGNRLLQLRKALEIKSQDTIARLSGGALQRIDVSRMESNVAKGQSARVVEGLAVAYSMSYEQMRALLDGRLPLHEAIDLARPTLARAEQLLESDRHRVSTLNNFIEKANEEREEPLSDEMVDAVRSTARLLFSRIGYDQPPAAIIRLVRSMPEKIEKALTDMAHAARSDRSLPK